MRLLLAILATITLLFAAVGGTILLGQVFLDDSNDKVISSRNPDNDSNTIRSDDIRNEISSSGSSDEAAVLDAVYRNIKASNEEDFNGYMATIHSSSPLYDSTASVLRPMFDSYDLRYELREVEFRGISDGEAHVYFVLVTTDPSNRAAFTDNRLTGIFNLRLDNGVWKIYDQVIEDIEYLE